jgi:tRNA A37 threonylcarbamoyladenosine dehydratase
VKFGGTFLLMYSYFKNGITDTHPQTNIDLPELVNIIKNNPNQSKIEQIRLLKRAGDEKFRELKRELANITPNCVVKERDLKDDKFSINFLFSSGYIYFDIDNIPDIQQFKKEFIKKYGHQVSLVCISSGGDGLSILFKVANAISSKEQFDQLREGIRNTILKDEEIDSKPSDIGRAMFISSDPDVYSNYDNKINVNIRNTSQNIKGISKPITRHRGGNNKLNETFKLVPFDKVIKTINLRTVVNVHNPVVDVIPVDFATVKFPRIIKDKNKHRIYTGMIHSLVYLNPGLQVDYIFSYLHFINYNYADPPMEFREFTRLFNSVYSKIKNEKDYKYSWIKVKHIHFNAKSGLTGDEKRCIAGMLNGQKRKNESINKIMLAKEELVAQGIKVTQKSVCRISGLSIATVKRHYHEGLVDLNELIETIENSLPSKLNILRPEIPNDSWPQEQIPDPGAIEPEQQLVPHHSGEVDINELVVSKEFHKANQISVMNL